MATPVPKGHQLYRCLVRGENFPGEMLTLPYDVGFYTTRFVTAADAGAAEMAVLAMLKEDPALARPDVPAEKAKRARVYFEKIEVVPDDTPQTPNSGFTFFQMGE